MSRFEPCGNGATETAGIDEPPKHTAMAYEQLLTEQLMERVVTSANMNMAYKRVVSNKGSAGIDQMTVDELKGWIYEHKETLLQSLLDGTISATGGSGG